MIVCICNAVSDRQIREAVKNGAATMSELRSATGCGTTCGKCSQMAVEIISESTVSHRASGIPGLAMNSGFSPA
ncbi:MAG: bacterioferritin-associated ferredoxin [Lysobacterales bacterium]